MRGRVLDKCCETIKADEIAATRTTLLADVEAYLAQIEDKYRQKGALEWFDRALYAEAHALLNDPPALHALIVSHMRTMWDTFLEPEWARVEPMLRESVAAFQKLDHTGMNLEETFRIITTRPLPDKWQENLNEVEHITFIPSAHIGPYLSMMMHEKTAWVIFGARIPEGVQMASPALSRSELLVRLSALADDTRLRILELLAREGEQCAKDIIARLDLSQSAASRHLRQLTATGYLIERRQEGNKCYRLNPDRVDDTLSALSGFLQ